MSIAEIDEILANIDIFPFKRTILDVLLPGSAGSGRHTNASQFPLQSIVRGRGGQDRGDGAYTKPRMVAGRDFGNTPNFSAHFQTVLDSSVRRLYRAKKTSPSSARNVGKALTFEGLLCMIEA